ncbi:MULTISPECIES: hypothetical protein [unclassified Sphingomonas]|uniref:hypothetical protein n=1 Tax=unclassified Sphingomonas TaxID=196159 RepID=UPI0028650E3B|nr:MULTISPECIES: hypothetical protein [unclassified Sphingomonas]MDR6116799.1 hypothetical protein [Sphingomonas sp. SORGH_AS_0789]MDR6151862.1 hypothetical protein [Sphingomonas sp. SORGH_AS_0742]
MLLLLVIVLGALLALLWSWGGPVRSLLIAWLVCLAPTAFGMVSYDYLVFTGNDYLFVIAASIGAFLIGAAMVHLRPNRYAEPRAASLVQIDFAADYARWRRIGTWCLPIAAISIIMTALNIVTSGLDLSNLAAVRADVIDMTGATVWARIAAVTTWACFLCLGLGIYFRSEMGPWRAALYMSMASGIFLNMLSLAGRNAVLQLILFCLALEATRTSRRRAAGLGNASSLSTRLAIGSAGAFYMLFITLNRSSDGSAGDRNATLYRLFNANLSPKLDAALDYVPFLKSTIVEFILYVTHTAPLFAISMRVDFGRHFYGIFSFPFLLRQLEPIFGHSVAAALDLKRLYIQSAGVIGFGWTTALSSFIMDFGYTGCIVVMFIQGFSSQYIWRITRAGGNFAFVMMNVLMIISAAFIPFLPFFSDTGQFLLMIALLAFAYALRNKTAGAQG